MWRARVNTKGFQKWIQDGQLKLFGETERVLDRVGAEAQRRARSKFKSRTGELSRSIKVRKVNQYAVDLSASAPHAGFVENGTRPHDIVPHGRALRFVVNGRAVFTRTVHHPGTKATHFLSDGARSIRPLFQQLLLEAVNRSFR